MSTLGIRCSNADFAYAVLTGTKDAPVLRDCGLVGYPRGFSGPESLKWLLQELEALNVSHDVHRWAIKGAEPMATRSKTFAERIEFEAMVSLSAANLGRSTVVRKVKQTIAKDLGLPGKVSSLTNGLNHSLIPGLVAKPDKIFEAIVVAWSELK